MTAFTDAWYIAGAMRRFVAFVVLGLCPLACKKSPEEAAAQAQADAATRVQQICDAMNDLSLAYVAGLVEQEVESLEAPGVRDQLRTACKALPLDVVQCADRLALDDPACEAALAKQMGLTDDAPQGEGPPPSWALRTPFELYDLEPAPDGRIAIAGDTGLGVVAADGTAQWTVELQDSNARVAWWNDCVLTGVGGELRCHGDGGAVRWSTLVAKGDGEWLSAIEAGPGGKVTVVTTVGDVVRIDGDRCAAGSDGCITPVGTVEALGGASIEVLADGAILGASDTWVTLVSATGAVLARKAVDYDAGIPKDGLIVVKSEVLRANPACTPDAADCFAVLARDKEPSTAAPVELEGVGVAYTDGYGVIVMTGSTQWKVDAGNDGDLFTDGTLIYSVGHQLGLGDALEAPPQLRAIDARTGRTRWITKLGTERAGLLSGYIVARSGGSLLVATKTQLFSVPIGG